MAKELEAEDIELKEYSFTPKEIRLNGITVLDYTEVENDKVFLCNKKDILDKPRPSWIPELDSKGLAIDKFLPICVKDFSDGNYFVQSKIYTGEKDSNGKSIYKNQIYKMSPDVLAATVDYYLKRKRAELKTEGSSEKVSLPRGMNSMPTNRYNEISKLCLLCDVPSLKYKNVDKSITDKAFEMKGKSPGKLYQIQNNVVFLEQWQPLLENIKGKRLDMNYQKQDYIDSYSKAVETAYGDSKTFNNLYNDFGVKIKKQNGTNFSKPEIEKLSETRNPNMEKPMDLGPEKSPYDGIRFFDRNYNESEDFAKFFNSNIHLFKKGKESAITEEDAATILKAIGYEKDGIVEQRKLRVGLDNKDKIVILTSENGNVKTEKIELSDILEFAKNKAEERVIESKQMLQNYLGKEPVVKKDLQDIFISLYETCVTQSEEIDSKMKLLYDSFIGKKHEQVKEAALYQRNSYRGWEISTDKDFKKSVYCRPFEQTDRSGYILMAGKEGKDGFWQEKFVREMLKSNNWSEREALIETLTMLASDKETCTSLGIKEPQSLNEFFSSLDKIIHVENDTDIKNELMESLLGPSEAHKVSKESTKELSVGDKLGEDTVSDLFWISDGVCQATLSREVNGVGSAQNYFVIDNSIINQLDEELKELVVSFDSKSVIENKSYEPYILKELIEKGLMPPRDDEFIQQLDEYISVHPLKYEKLKPVDYLNFERKLQEIAEVDKAFNKTPFELGQQLIALVDDSDRERLNIWLRKQGCDSREHMAEVFDSWLNNKEQKKDITPKKNNGYPPRGEQ